MPTGLPRKLYNFSLSILLFWLAKAGNPPNDDLRQYLCSVYAASMASLPEYIKEALNGLPRSLTVEHHQHLLDQGLGENPRMGAIHFTWGLLTVEQAGLQLGALE